MAFHMLYPFFLKERDKLGSNRWSRMCTLRKGKNKQLKKVGILCNSLLPFYQKGSIWDELLDVRVLSLSWHSFMFVHVHSLYESKNETKWCATKPYHLSNLNVGAVWTFCMPWSILGEKNLFLRRWATHSLFLICVFPFVFFFLYVSFPTQFLLDIVGKGPMLHFQNYIKKKKYMKSIWKKWEFMTGIFFFCHVLGCIRSPGKIVCWRLPEHTFWKQGTLVRSVPLEPTYAGRGSQPDKWQCKRGFPCAVLVGNACCRWGSHGVDIMNPGSGELMEEYSR